MTQVRTTKNGQIGYTLEAGDDDVVRARITPANDLGTTPLDYSLIVELEQALLEVRLAVEDEATSRADYRCRQAYQGRNDEKLRRRLIRWGLHWSRVGQSDPNPNNWIPSKTIEDIVEPPYPVTHKEAIKFAREMWPDLSGVSERIPGDREPYYPVRSYFHVELVPEEAD